MAIRTHLGRDLDLRLPSNLALVVTIGAAGIIAGLIWLNGNLGDRWLAPGAALVYWILTREIDPDHWWTATLASIFTATWVLLGYESVSLLAIAALGMAARLIAGSTGRRPLLSDLLVVGAGGIAIGYTFAGWVGGFGLAVAIFLEWSYRDTSTRVSPVVAGATAAGTTVVATLSGAFPQSVPDTDRSSLLLIGALALYLIVREPAPHISVVDARHSAALEATRVHVARIVVGLALFTITLGDGLSLAVVAPLAVTMTLVAISNEIPTTPRT